MPPMIRLSDFDFLQQQTLWLTLAHEGDIEPVDKAALRQWLCEAPRRMEKTSLAAWVSLTGLLVWATLEDEAGHPNDAILLRAVLEHALTVPLHVWMAEGEPLVKSKPNPNYVPNEDDEEMPDARPAYDALRSLLGMLSFADAGVGPHPSIVALFESDWNPGPLLHYLDQAREIQGLYVCTEHTPKTSTAQGFLLEGVLSAMGNSSWRPPEHPAMAMLWDKEAHAYYKYDSPTGRDSLSLRNKEQRLAARAAYEAFPQYAGKALLAYLQWPEMRQHMKAETFFPFPFDQSHDLQTLEALVRTWQQQNSVSSGTKALCNELKKHHPDVAHLLEMHCSFYSQPNHALQHLSDITMSFRQIVGREKPQMFSIEHLDLGT